MRFALNHDLDAGQLARRFADSGRLRIDGFLEGDTAERLHAALRARTDWVQVVNSGDKTFELTRETRAGMAADQLRALDEAVYATARNGFQYRYESIRVPDDAAARAASDDVVAAFAEWMSGGVARDFLRHVTGEAGIDFADAQATAYAPGDFLTGHDDAVAGKNRHAAYVLGLSPDWRLEWGGLLLFHGADGMDAEAFPPRFNCLNIFRVPQLHSVSEVTRAAAWRRYAITGWLRGSPA